MSREREPAKGIPLPDSARRAWLRLYRSENVGPVTFRQLVNRYGGAEAALEALPELAARGGAGRRLAIADPAAIDEEMVRAERMGARFVCMGEPDFPPLLLSSGHAPPIVALMGEAAVFRRPSVAIVGARNASLSGVKLTTSFASALGEAGYVIVSGLARGIDAAAHEAGLATGTVGVFAGGLDRPYPPENRPLMRRIVDGGGALISEMPFGWEPRAVDFPRRNRIVATLGLGLLVVEAALRSGSLISARLANELGRLVFAVPGSPLDPRAGGSNKLLKDGAIIATEPGDLIEALRPLDKRMAGIAPERLDETEECAPDDGEPAETDRARVREALGPTPASFDDIVAHTGVAPGIVHLTILELDIAGRIERHGDGTISLLL